MAEPGPMPLSYEARFSRSNLSMENLATPAELVEWQIIRKIACLLLAS